MEHLELFFNEAAHSYKDNRGFIYTSMTTVIGKYEIKFEDTQRETAAACSRSKNSQYYGMSVKSILNIWKQENKQSLVKGNRIHNYLENAVKQASGYNLVDNTFINDRIYTVNNLTDLLVTPKGSALGELNLDFFIKSGVMDKYPRIFKLVSLYVEAGYRIFSEIGIFDPERLISGLIDILLINPYNKRFVILDWKTNKKELIPFGDERYKWISGYFKKDKAGKVTRNFIKTNTYMKTPLNMYQQSGFVIYSLQLSGYATLVEKLGYTCEGIVLTHIREEVKYKEGDIEVSRIPALLGLDVTDVHEMPYLKEDVNKMFNHHYNTFTNKQSTLL